MFNFFWVLVPYIFINTYFNGRDYSKCELSAKGFNRLFSYLQFLLFFLLHKMWHRAKVKCSKASTNSNYTSKKLMLEVIKYK